MPFGKSSKKILEQGYKKIRLFLFLFLCSLLFCNFLLSFLFCCHGGFTFLSIYPPNKILADLIS